jgi:precorrin-2 dehydrogenase / sirohydrochlorin ferrochelatase
MKSQLYPLFINLTGRRVVVIGGGAVAARKVESLLRCGAAVTVVAPTLTGKLSQLAQRGKIKHHGRPYHPGDLAEAVLVFSACGDPAVNQTVFAEAGRLGVFCNVADEPDYCSFFVPSVVRRGPLQIAVSTTGTSPALAKRLRQQLESLFDESYIPYLDALARLRRRLRALYPDDQRRRAKILESFLDSNALVLLQQGKTLQFKKLFNKFLHPE